jgi:NAD(P)-dependent dehydrogenase (short-subunit alcohol dehydrogenase family)
MRRRLFTGWPEIVVITGASAGVGRATARAFARRGALIGLIARGEDGLAATAGEVEALGGKALVLPADVAEPADIEAAAEAVERHFGPIDIWINNAMATIFSAFGDITPEEFRRATEVTYLGTVYGTMAALKRMRPRNRGSIVQVDSALGYRAIPLQAPYCGAKFAVRGFTDSLRSELLHDGLEVNLTLVCLPAMNTPQFDWARNKTGHAAQPVPPIFQPEVAAQAIVHAATHRLRELWVGTPTIKAILANKLFPGLLDRLLARRGYRGQLTDRPSPRDSTGNLFAPVRGDHGAHGRFDDRPHPNSLELWGRRHRSWIAGGMAALVGLALGLTAARRR